MTGPASSQLSCNAAAKAQHASHWMQKAHSFMTVSVAGICPSREARVLSPAPFIICKHLAFSPLSSQQPAPISLCFPSDRWNNLPAGKYQRVYILSLTKNWLAQGYKYPSSLAPNWNSSETDIVSRAHFWDFPWCCNFSWPTSVPGSSSLFPDQLSQEPLLIKALHMHLCLTVWRSPPGI